MTKQKSSNMVPRFNIVPRIAHWTYAGSFFLLYLSGMPKLYHGTGFRAIYNIFGGPAGAQLTHRICAVTLMSSILISLIFDKKSLFFWLKQCITWKKKDIEFVKAFPKEFFGGHVKVPKQGFLNGGTKINSILQILCCVGFVTTGLIMWFPGFFSETIVQWSYPLHVVSFSLATAVVVGHIYMAAIHPNARSGLRGMIHGDVPESYAKAHHGEWYDEMVATGQYVPSKTYKSKKA